MLFSPKLNNFCFCGSVPFIKGALRSFCDDPISGNRNAAGFETLGGFDTNKNHPVNNFNFGLLVNELGKWISAQNVLLKGELRFTFVSQRQAVVNKSILQ